MQELKVTGEITNVPSDTSMPVVDLIIYYYGSGRAFEILAMVA